MELSSPVSMETCDCLQSSESDPGAQVLGGQSKLPKKSSEQGGAGCVHGQLAPECPCPRLQGQLWGTETSCHQNPGGLKDALPPSPPCLHCVLQAQLGISHAGATENCTDGENVKLCLRGEVAGLWELKAGPAAVLSGSVDIAD